MRPFLPPADDDTLTLRRANSQKSFLSQPNFVMIEELKQQCTSRDTSLPSERRLIPSAYRLLLPRRRRLHPSDRSGEAGAHVDSVREKSHALRSRPFRTRHALAGSQGRHGLPRRIHVPQVPRDRQGVGTDEDAVQQRAGGDPSFVGQLYAGTEGRLWRCEVCRLLYGDGDEEALCVVSLALGAGGFG